MAPEYPNKRDEQASDEPSLFDPATKQPEAPPPNGILTMEPSAGYLAWAKIRDTRPDLLEMFERYARYLVRRGHKRGSARMIVHRMRWEMRFERVDAEWKISNAVSPYLSRWLAQKDPETFGDWFENRNALADREMETLG